MCHFGVEWSAQREQRERRPATKEELLFGKYLVEGEIGRGRRGRVYLVRHMVLPGHRHESMALLDWLWQEFGDTVQLSLMNQYTPMPGIGERYPELGRRITRREYDKVVDFALQIGITNAFVQEGETAKESFIPEFDGTGL